MELRFLIFGLPCALIVASAVLGLRNFKVPQQVLLIGDASYSIYLTHSLVLTLWGRHLPHFPEILSFAVCIVIGPAVYVLIERPMTQWLRTWVRHARTPSIMKLSFPAATVIAGEAIHRLQPPRRMLAFAKRVLPSKNEPESY